MKTITEQIVERLEELAVEWSNHTPQCEALFMAAKEALTFQEKEKEVMCEFAVKCMDGIEYGLLQSEVKTYYNETFNTKEK
jgi:hypothetical protein